MNTSDVFERVPIHTDAGGVIRVARTRVTADTTITAFEGGAAAEEVTLQFPSVPLVDVYSVITYHLRHQAEVDSYLTAREQIVARARVKGERRSPSSQPANS